MQKKRSDGPQEVQKRPKMWSNQKQKYRAVLTKPKLIVYIGKSQQKFEPDLNSRNSSERVQKVPKRPQLWPNKKQKGGVVIDN